MSFDNLRYLSFCRLLSVFSSRTAAAAAAFPPPVPPDARGPSLPRRCLDRVHGEAVSWQKSRCSLELSRITPPPLADRRQQPDRSGRQVEARRRSPKRHRASSPDSLRRHRAGQKPASTQNHWPPVCTHTLAGSSVLRTRTRLGQDKSPRERTRAGRCSASRSAGCTA